MGGERRQCKKNVKCSMRGNKIVGQCLPFAETQKLDL